MVVKRLLPNYFKTRSSQKENPQYEDRTTDLPVSLSLSLSLSLHSSEDDSEDLEASPSNSPSLGLSHTSPTPHAEVTENNIGE